MCNLLAYEQYHTSSDIGELQGMVILKVKEREREERNPLDIYLLDVITYTFPFIFRREISERENLQRDAFKAFRYQNVLRPLFRLQIALH